MDTSDGVMFDEASARRLGITNRLVENNPEALYSTLPSGPMFDRPYESPNPYETLFIISNFQAIIAEMRSVVWYRFNINQFYGSFYNTIDSTDLPTFMIHSFKMDLQSAGVTDWIEIPPQATTDPNDFVRLLGENIQAALEALPLYNSNFFIFERMQVSVGALDTFQFTFGEERNQTFNQFQTVITEFYSYAAIKEIRYVSVDPDSREIISAPSNAYFINPFYIEESHYYVDTANGTLVKIIVDTSHTNSHLLNYFQGFIGYGIRMDDGLYLVPNVQHRIPFPLSTIRDTE